METRKNEEYAAFNQEIATAEEFIANLEEKQLLLMEQLESFVPELHRAEEIHAIEHKRLNAILGTIEGRHKSLVARQEEFIKERPRLLDGIDEDLLERYERLLKSKGSAVVPLEHGVCTGCRMQMTLQTILSTKAEKEMVSCTQCGRLLYTEED